MSRHFHHRRQHEHHHRGHDVRDLSDTDLLKDRIPSAVQKDASEVATVVSVVYMTASQTFSGSIGGYVTVTSSPPRITQTQAPAPSSVSASQDLPLETTTQWPPSTILQPAPASTPSSVATLSSPSVLSPEPIATTVTTSLSTAATTPDSTALLQSISIISASPTHSANAASSSTLASAAPQSSASSSNPGGVAPEKSSGGLSGGAKAGVAIGALLGIAAVLGLVFFCYCRRKNRNHKSKEWVENEKNPFGDNAAIPAVITPASQPAPSRVPTLPQLSLRPVTQFHPELLGRGRKAADVLGITGAITTAASATQRENTPANPFEDCAVGTAAPPVVSNRPLSSSSTNLTTNEIPAPLRIRTPSPESEAGVVAGAAIAQRHNAPKPLDIKRSASPAPNTLMAALEAAAPSPAATEFSMTSESATSITNGPGAMNVHRIQLDFKPSMDDELELRAGQLVRLLHEYDDGWALCIRLDRSQQGVAPRTCLSTRPVKPRAKGPLRTGTPEGPRFAGANAQNSHSLSPLAERPAQSAISATSVAQRSGLPALNISAVQQTGLTPDTMSPSGPSSATPNAEVPAFQPAVQRKPVGGLSP